VLQQARVNSGSLYHHFPGKRELLLAVLDAYRAGIGPMLLEPAWEGLDDLLARYRQALAMTLARNFEAWVGAVENCLDTARGRFPRGTDRRALAEFVLTTMEGAVMQARTHRDLACFDRSVAHLRNYFDLLARPPRKGARP
jgi:TetR/AcrR family transcriptional repressor of nem operon